VTEAETPLAPLKVPVHFVLMARRAQWQDLMGGQPPASADAMAARFVECADCWVAQTYVQLRRRGVAVTFSDRYERDAVNVVSRSELKIRDWPARHFVVGVQHDKSRPAICDQRVVQNEINVWDARVDHFVPHWPQPGLIRRDPARGARLENLCFKGARTNLYDAFRSDAFLAELAKLGMKLVFDIKDNAERQPHRWFDYGECDAVLAVRDATAEDLKLKPASKLVNAWRAGAPALLSPEPAYRALRRGPLDYFEVSTPAEALAALRRLRDEPWLYAAMVDNGLRRGATFSPDAVARRWHDVLGGPVATAFGRWRRWRGVLMPVRWAAFPFQCLKHKRFDRQYRAVRDVGHRPVREANEQAAAGGPGRL